MLAADVDRPFSGEVRRQQDEARQVYGRRVDDQPLGRTATQLEAEETQWIGARGLHRTYLEEAALGAVDLELDRRGGLASQSDGGSRGSNGHVGLFFDLDEATNESRPRSNVDRFMNTLACSGPQRGTPNVDIHAPDEEP